MVDFTHNYGKIHHFSWENSLKMVVFQFAMSTFRRPGIHRIFHKLHGPTGKLKRRDHGPANHGTGQGSALQPGTGGNWRHGNFRVDYSCIILQYHCKLCIIMTYKCKLEYIEYIHTYYLYVMKLCILRAFALIPL